MVIDKNGDFRCRGYNQTNDRYFTKSTLTTQGVGLMYKKRFQYLGRTAPLVLMEKKERFVTKTKAMTNQPNKVISYHLRK